MAGRIGVYICHCGSNIRGTVDCDRVSREVSGLENVVVARDYPYLCSDPGQQIIKEDIREMGLDRIVVAACSPRMHEPTFRNILEESGLNSYLMEMANIREQCSWVHLDREAATSKAVSLVSGAVYKVRLNRELKPREVTVTRAVMVIGGGIAGIHAALALSAAGKKVYLVERSASIGGHMAQLDKTFPTLDCSACILTPKMVDVARSHHIEMLTSSELVKLEGFTGNFTATVRAGPRFVDVENCNGCGRCEEACTLSGKIPSEFDRGLSGRGAIYIPFPQSVPLAACVDPGRCLLTSRGKCSAPCLEACEPGAIDFDAKEELLRLEVGALIVATGYETFPAELLPQFGYGRYPQVLDALQFERMLSASGPTGGRIETPGGEEPGSIAFLHCIGSRDENAREYCSRVCCMYTVKQAFQAREKLDADIYEFYIDVTSFGKGCQEFYRRARDSGVFFIRGKCAEVARLDGLLKVFAEDTLLGRRVELPVDMVVLATGLVPSGGADELAGLLGVQVGPDGFFLEAHPKLRPVESHKGGIFLAGCCQGPKDIPDTVAQAGAAAAEAVAMLDRGTVEVEAAVARVVRDECTGCEICARECPCDAIVMDDEGKAEVNEVLCKGCGLCASACLSGAATVEHYDNGQILANIEGLLL